MVAEKATKSANGWGGARANSGGARKGAGRPRKASAAIVAQVEAALPSDADQIKRAARSGGRDEAIRAGQALGWGEDEICALTGYKPIVEKRAPLATAEEPKTATELKGFCLAALKQIVEHSQSDSARVQAVKELHSRIDAEAAATGLGGKKGAQKAAAEARVAAGGKFAPPQAPGTTRAQ